MLNVYGDIYVKGYSKFPYQKLTGRKILLYTGSVKCGYESMPSYIKDDDLYIDCDCQFSEYKELKKIFRKNKK